MTSPNQNKRVVYDLLMKAAAETTLAIASDPKRLGARIGVTAVLHTWGSALTQNPHSRYRALSSPLIFSEQRKLVFRATPLQN